MRYTDIHQDVEQYSITEDQPTTLYTIGFARELIYDTLPIYTLTIDYIFWTDVEYDRSLFTSDFTQRIMTRRYVHRLKSYPTPEEITKIIKKDKKNTEEYNKEHAKPCDCTKCIYYKDNSSPADDPFDGKPMICTCYGVNRYTRLYRGECNCDEYKEK